MRWGALDFSFVRPIHWVLALFNGEVISFEVAGVKSGNMTRGHRFMAPQTMEVADLQDYFRRMEESSVIIDHKAREKEVKKIVVSAASAVSGTPAMDPELLSTVTNMVEFPSAVCGSFENEFLNIPEPVLITAMKKHQKYFAIRDSRGQLMPNFVAVNNTLTRDESVVQKGHERVLRARLSDADFFFKEDRKRPLQNRLEDLKEVIYQAKLGTSFAKVQRFARLAEYLVEQVLPEKMDDVKLAAELCKCDLVTEMVMEFPTLQGIMGKEYARLDGHPEEVCLAIHEHYLPARAGDELPTSPIGAIVGLGDRMDTVSGFFAIEMEPTGAADPFALRRHALAIIRILEKMQWNISLEGFIAKSISILREEIEFDKDLVTHKVLGFFRERYKNMLLRSGYESDLIDAIISVNFEQINQLRSRIDQLKKFMTESEEFESLALTFKRVRNILKNQDESLPVDENLFREPCESDLWEAYQALKDDISASVERGDYFEALNLMVRLRKPVDDLFDGVEILTKEDTQLRNNRVGMLQNLARLFLSLADFSKFSI
jgi:glycyl-tRNA synthetase beta chain